MADLKLSVDVSDVQKALTATQRYERQINQLAQRYARGQVSSAAYNRGLLQIKRSYEQLGLSSQKATSEVRRYAQQQLQAARDIQQAAVAQRNFAAATQTSTRGLNRSGVITQQAGYQIGDFIVQVQSGTNAFVAFGQQATQVAGTLTLLGGKFVGIGTVLGIAIPLATALGAAFMRTREEAENLTEIEEILQSIQDQARETYREVQAFQFGFGTDVESYQLTLRLNQLLAERLEVQRQIQELEQLGTITGPNRRRLSALDEEINSLREALDLRQRQIELEQRQERISNMADEAAQRYIARQEETRELARQLAIQEEINRYGEDSVQVAELRAAFARQMYSEEARRLSVSESQYRQLMAQYDALQRAKQAAEGTADAVESIDFTSSIAGARELARSLGVSLSTARLIAGIGGPGVGGEALDPRSPRYNPAAAAQAQRDAQLAAIRESFETPSRTGRTGGGGGGGTPEFASRVFGPELQEAIEQAQQDLSRYNQEVQMLDSALRAGLITQQEYNSFVAQAQEVYNQAQQGAYDYQKALEQVEKTAMSSMENAFMSIIDGSKSASEAFKDMARQILAEAMRMMVIRPLIQGLFGGGGGGGFLGGIFGARASGGTMMAGEPYLVGERGPELVMPSRSGTVMNADLTRKAMGGSDGVVVNNNITVTGGTDPAAIRQEVAKLMPQITNATKTAVIDARRRGGQMRAAFQ